MSATSRRSFLGAVGGGCLLTQLPSATPPATTPRRLGDLTALVRNTARGDLLPKAAELHRGGVHWRELLGAAFLAGIEDVEPRPVGFAFHCALMTSSAFDIAQALPERERLAAALYNLDDFKQSQANDAARGDWTLPPAGKAAEGDLAKVTAALRDALEGYDAEAADRAAIALARTATMDHAFEPLWWFGARDFTNIGHNPIFVAQAYRTLQQIGWQHAEPVLRALVWGLLDGKPGTEDATFRANLERSERCRLPAAGRHSAPAAREVLTELRKCDAERAAAMVEELLEGGLSTASLLDGLRLFAIEQLWRLPGLLAVHPLTALSALRVAGELAAETRTRAMALLQAASWLVHYREFLARNRGYRSDAPGVDTFAAEDGDVGVDEVFAAAPRDGDRAAALAMTAARRGLAPLVDGARRRLVRKVHEHHDYKFTATLLEEMQLASPDVGARLFAAGTCWLRHDLHDDHPLWRVMATR